MATYICGGYDQPWLDETPYIALALERANQRKSILNESWNAQVPLDFIAAAGILPPETIAKHLHLSGFEEDICRSFVFHRLCGPQYSKAMSWWLSSKPNVEVQSRTLVSASKAMSMALFGRAQRQKQIVTDSHRLYGEALIKLSTDLSHPVKAFTFETLGATLALNMYELVHMAPGSPTFISHAGGIGKLLYARGPELHKTYPEKSIYVEIRLLLVAEGAYMLYRTFLEEQRWKDVPWEDDLPAKTPFDYVVDVFSDIPGFLQQVTSSPISLPDATPAFQKIALQRELAERLAYVKVLQEEWQVRYSGPLWQIPPKHHYPATPRNISSMTVPEAPFETVLYFTDTVRANDFLIYNTTLILLIMLYEIVSQDINPLLSHPSALVRDLFPETTLQSLARDVCRCTEYLMLDINGARGYIVLALPATIAYFAIDEDSPEALWLHYVCKRHAEGSGFGFADTVLENVTPLTKWMRSCNNRLRPSQAFPRR